MADHLPNISDFNDRTLKGILKLSYACLALVLIVLLTNHFLSVYNVSIKEVKIRKFLSFSNLDLIPNLAKSKIPLGESKTLNVRKIGELKKTKSNRNLFSSATFGPQKPRKKGLLFPTLRKPQSEAC